MNQPLPEPLATYFRAKSGQQTDEIINCFSPNAVIVDEGENKEIRGQEAIRDWIEGPIAAYDLTTDVQSWAQLDDQIVVSASVSGNFPGSPIDFDYHFVLNAGKIERLVIR